MGAWIEITVFQGIARAVSSHPPWVRGLKFITLYITCFCVMVAPHMGAWIEILEEVSYTDLDGRRTPHGCVDWNADERWKPGKWKVAPHMGAWIEIVIKSNVLTDFKCRTPHGCVDWNIFFLLCFFPGHVAPHMGAWIEICLLLYLSAYIWSHPTWVRGL